MSSPIESASSETLTIVAASTLARPFLLNHPVPPFRLLLMFLLSPISPLPSRSPPSPNPPLPLSTPNPPPPLIPLSSPSLPLARDSWLNRLKPASISLSKVDSICSISASGKPRVKIPNEVFERGAKLHENCLVRLFYGNPPPLGKIRVVLNHIWGKGQQIQVHHMEKNAFLIQIHSSKIRSHVLNQALWYVGKYVFFVQEWKPRFSLNPPSLQYAPIWAKIPSIPFDLITAEGLSHLASVLRDPIESKPFTSINSADVKVLADLSAPLPDYIKLEKDDGSVTNLPVSHPWLLAVCSATT